MGKIVEDLLSMLERLEYGVYPIYKDRDDDEEEEYQREEEL